MQKKSDALICNICESCNEFRFLNEFLVDPLVRGTFDKARARWLLVRVDQYFGTLTTFRLRRAIRFD